MLKTGNLTVSFNKNDGSGLSDVVVLPRHFGLLNLPIEVRFFIGKISLKRSHSSSSYFSFGVLEKLFAGNRSLFDRISYFLSLYGANFLTNKMSSFFPNDIHDMEQVIRFTGPRDISIPPKMVDALGIKRFCRLAGGALYSYLDGVVVSRIKSDASINLEELFKDNRFLLTDERLYGRDDEIVLPKNVFYAGANTVKVKRKVEKTTLKPEEKAFRDATESQETNHDGNASKEKEELITIEEKEIIKKTDDLPNGEIVQKKQNERKRPKPCAFKGKNYLCAPLFWIRFVCSFFVMAKEIKEVYRSFGCEMFEDLILLTSKDIGSLVRKMQDAEGIDRWTVGDCEEELVSYCHSKSRFLKKHSATDLREFIFSGNHFEGLRDDKEMVIIDLVERPHLRESFRSEDGSLPETSNLVLSYLERFGVHDFSFLGEEILQKEICCYGLSNEDERLRFLLKPYKVVGLLCSEFMEQGEGNAFAIDEELRLLSYYDNCLKPSFDHIADKFRWKSERNYEIATLLDGGEFTLQELGQRYGCSRERIRQIGLSSILRAYPCLHILDKLVSCKGWIPLSFFSRSIPGLIAAIKKDRPKDWCCYLDDLDVVVSRIEANLIEEDESFAVRRGYCVSRRDIEAFYEKHGFSLYPWLNANSYRVDFTPYPSFAFQKTGMKDVARQYLFSRGSFGFNSITDREDATRFFRSVFSLPSDKPISWRSIMGAVLKSGCIRRSSRTYINPSFVKDKQIKIVRSVLSEIPFDSHSVPASSIFELNKQRLLSYGIDNKYFFFDIAYHFLGDAYRFKRKKMQLYPKKR